MNINSATTLLNIPARLTVPFEHTVCNQHILHRMVPADWRAAMKAQLKALQQSDIDQDSLNVTVYMDSYADDVMIGIDQYGKDAASLVIDGIAYCARPGRIVSYTMTPESVSPHSAEVALAIRHIYLNFDTYADVAAATYSLSLEEDRLVINSALYVVVGASHTRPSLMQRLMGEAEQNRQHMESIRTRSGRWYYNRMLNSEDAYCK